ncbi:MAG TPA: hypothetical protein DFS52_01165 [Myxococcales bacterium]|nr:hypothetical protein [Myxococcales bacterium]
MTDTLRPLLTLAFDRGPAHQANARIQAAREKVEASGAAQARSYELVVPPEATLAWLAQEVLPRLVYHLDSLGLRPPAVPGLFVSLFVGDEVFFVHGGDLLQFASRALGLTFDEMERRWGTGELRGPVTSGPPLALPGPEQP